MTSMSRASVAYAKTLFGKPRQKWITDLQRMLRKLEVDIKTGAARMKAMELLRSELKWELKEVQHGRSKVPSRR